jgi:hypothetical protein
MSWILNINNDKEMIAMLVKKLYTMLGQASNQKLFLVEFLSTQHKPNFIEIDTRILKLNNIYQSSRFLNLLIICLFGN